MPEKHTEQAGVLYGPFADEKDHSPHIQLSSLHSGRETNDSPGSKSTRIVLSARIVQLGVISHVLTIVPRWWTDGLGRGSDGLCGVGFRLVIEKTTSSCTRWNLVSNFLVAQEYGILS